MHDQAIASDSSDAPPERRSMWAYAIAALGLLGTIAAILLIANGRNHAAESIATISFFALMGFESVACLVGLRDTSDKERSVISQGTGFGALAALFYLGICCWVSTWPLGDDAPLVFSRSGLSATFWIVLSMIQSIPLAYYIWRTSPFAAKD